MTHRIARSVLDPNGAGVERIGDIARGTGMDDERQMLIRVMDLGGQYYARQNTGFSALTVDPVGGGK